MARPQGAELVAPLVINEIVLRLLCSPIGGRVARIGLAGSSLKRIAKAVAWVRANYAQLISVEALAGLVGMSPSLSCEPMGVNVRGVSIGQTVAMAFQCSRASR